MMENAKKRTKAKKAAATEVKETEPEKTATTTKASTTKMSTNGTALRKTSSRKKVSSKLTQMVSHEEIARLAHRYWAERGRQHGHNEEDWFRAERELLGKAS